MHYKYCINHKLLSFDAIINNVLTPDYVILNLTRLTWFVVRNYDFIVNFDTDNFDIDNEEDCEEEQKGPDADPCDGCLGKQIGNKVWLLVVSTQWASTRSFLISTSRILIINWSSDIYIQRVNKEKRKQRHVK